MILSKKRILNIFIGLIFLVLGVFGVFKAVELIRVRNTPLVPLAVIQEALENEAVDQAMLYCQKRIQVNPEDTMSYLLLGECFEKKLQMDRAIKIYSQIAAKDVEEPMPYFYLGRAYYKKGQTDLAIQQLKVFKDLSDRRLTGEAKKESQKQGSAFLARIYMESKAYKKAIPELRSMLDNDPENQEVRYELGTAYAYSGQYQSAYREFQKIIDEEPGTDMARYAENAVQYVRERRSPDKSRYVLAG